MFNLFKTKPPPDQAFAKGQVLKMSPGAHTRHPYYVLVKDYNPNAGPGEVKMITWIPGRNECRMVVGSNWEYHLKRMTIIGSSAEHGHLLKNQKLT